MTFQKAIVNEKKRIHIVIELPSTHLYVMYTEKMKKKK